jgi:hypothetical protein
VRLRRLPRPRERFSEGRGEGVSSLSEVGEIGTRMVWRGRFDLGLEEGVAVEEDDWVA